MSGLPESIFGRWVHSREEDSAEARVYRPHNFSFPLARSRKAFEIRQDGTFIRHGIGPSDGPHRTVGRWVEQGNRVEVELEDGGRDVLVVLSCAPDLLKLKP